MGNTQNESADLNNIPKEETEIWMQNGGDSKVQQETGINSELPLVEENLG